MIELELAVGGEELGRQPCDGIICATPSGSTAYNLSNGGPVLVWGLEAMALTYVAAHSLRARPLVIPPGADVIVWNRTQDVEAGVLVDGHQVASLGKAERAVVASGPSGPPRHASRGDLRAAVSPELCFAPPPHKPATQGHERANRVGAPLASGAYELLSCPDEEQNATEERRSRRRLSRAALQRQLLGSDGGSVNPAELWEAFPLDPQATTPSPPPDGPAVESSEPSPRPTALLPEDEAGTGWSPFILGGIAASALLVSAGWVLLRTHRRAEPAPMRPATTAGSIARDYSLATECAMLLASQRDKGVESVSETADREDSAEEMAPSSSSGYAEIGERVAGVLSAAEEAWSRSAPTRNSSRRISSQRERGSRTGAPRSECLEADTRAAVDRYATERRREADQQVEKLLADAEAQARATREAAEGMARKIEEDGLQRGQTLRDASRDVEDWLKKAMVGLRGMTAQLEELVGTPAADNGGESLADALKPYGQRHEETPQLVEER